jgi:hypothetical protein
MMRNRAILLAIALIAAQPVFAAVPSPTGQTAPAADLEKDGAAQAVAIFLNCAHYGNDVSGVRKWATQNGFAEAPPDQAKPFLLGKAGKTYGGNTPSGELVLASQDDGVCTVFAGHAEGKRVLRTFETLLTQNGFTFSHAHPIEHSGRGGLVVVSRNYSVRGKGVPWHAVISITTAGASRFEAVLTAYRAKH